LEKSVEEVRKPWIGSPYYRNAERWTHLFWSETSDFRKLFNRLRLDSVVELACGHGRHAEIAAPLCKKLVLVDVIQENLDFFRNRLRMFENVVYKLGDGASFPLPGSSLTAIYCYDSMVHFAPEVVERYLADTARVLKPAGLALYHHSNLGETGETKWSANPHARNYMSAEKFASLAASQGLRVVEQRILAWGGVPNLDCISLVERP
jgi:ubiquinone/menaquinone biosynthesis C-methylase UbiE